MIWFFALGHVLGGVALRLFAIVTPVNHTGSGIALFSHVVGSFDCKFYPPADFEAEGPTSVNGSEIF